MIEIFIDFYKVKISNPFYSKIPRLIFTKLFRQLKIYPNFENQLKNPLYVRSWVKNQYFAQWGFLPLLMPLDPQAVSFLTPFKLSLPLPLPIVLLGSSKALNKVLSSLFYFNYFKTYSVAPEHPDWNLKHSWPEPFWLRV